MGWLFLCLILVFLLRPIYRVWVAARQVKRQFRQFQEAYNQASGSGGGVETGGRSSEGRHRGGWSEPPTRRKKIDPGVGEYVKFKEMEPASSRVEYSYEQTTVEVEEQVEDITFEEI